MGIDKSNIRFVVHMSLPKTIENYYQEIGRAGRDGLESDVLLLSSPADIVQKKQFIDQLEESAYKKSAYEKLSAIARFSTSEKCHHQQIADYFGDSIDDAVANLKEAVELYLEDEQGRADFHDVGDALIGEYAINA